MRVPVRNLFSDFTKKNEGNQSFYRERGIFFQKMKMRKPLTMVFPWRDCFRN